MYEPILIFSLFILLPWFVMRSKRWPTWKQYLTYEKECFHKWATEDLKMFRQCEKCHMKQYRVYTDSGLLSTWLILS